MNPNDPHDSSETQTPRRSHTRTVKIVAPVAAALLVGGGITFALDRQSGSSASAGVSSAATSSASAAANSSANGPLAGEQHINGTIIGKTATTVTVKASDGTSATYTVNSTTQIERNGQAATLADIQVDDPVLVHVYPSSSGQTLVERLLAGTSATDPGPGGGRHGDGGQGNSPAPTTTTPPVSIS
jgi:hypothetical protein